MICRLRGTVLECACERDALRVVLDVQGVGYEVFVPKSGEQQLRVGQPATILVRESVTAFDGAVTLYGFLSREERDIFVRIRENVDGVGPKKGLEFLDKISKSPPDFKRAIEAGDPRLLVSIFGFTKKTAEKLVAALKGQMDSWEVSGPVKWATAMLGSGELEALSGLVNLGYREDEARDLIKRAKARLGAEAGTEQILQEALRAVSAGR